MQEALLQFIWQYNLYRPGTLRSTQGSVVEVQHPGTRNTDAGPDFSMARIKIGNTLLVGNVELHVRSSDWARHRHDEDAAYRHVILHVVFEDDGGFNYPNIPLLELKDHIPDYVLERYSQLIQTTAPLPCAQALPCVKEITRSTWLNRMLVERWEEKLSLWDDELKQASGDWYTLLWWRLAANFGFKINAAPFLMLAQSLPLRILLRQTSLMQVEALLFGQAGFLQGNFLDEYPRQLQKEYHYFQHKYELHPAQPGIWKFLRLRPANFPSIRIAQLAALVHQAPGFFHELSEHPSLKDTVNSLKVHASSYWDTHYRFDETPSRKTVKKLGTDAAQNIIINTLAPIRFLYAHTQGRAEESEKALQLLENLPAEDNRILRIWAAHGWLPRHAGESQALIQLYNRYCSNKRCLDCAVGLSIIRAK
ncbi:MAG: DUF2851 family protein [Bacteroidetes bacterium]|nr:DUF2851 family protein [Bacteroidota bacterium]MBS1629616.1 DUF2851 family protein [Bacteroidota bacterium]